MHNYYLICSNRKPPPNKCQFCLVVGSLLGSEVNTSWVLNKHQVPAVCMALLYT